MRTSERLGALIPDGDIPEWLVSKPMKLGFLPGVSVPFILEDVEQDANPREFEIAVQNFLQLRPTDRDQATPHVYTYYTNVVGALDPADVHVRIGEPGDVWNHVCPTAVHVSRRHRHDKKIYVQLMAECDWEPEHGLQIVFRDGAVLSRVSDQDGHLTHADAFALPESEDRIA